MSPMAYLRRMRVEQMARLLVSTDLSIAEVTRLAVSHFCQVMIRVA